MSLSGFKVIFAPKKRYKKVPLCNIRGGTTGTGKTNHSPLARKVLPRSRSWGIGALCIKNEREKKMKKLLLTTLVLVAGIAQADFWDNCTAYGGTIITANSYGNDKGGLCNDPSDTNLTNNCNGKRFCLGGNKMNWSAFTWCESIGGQLASFESVCPGIQLRENDTQGACPNLTKVSDTDKIYGWNATKLPNSNSVGRINIKTGNIRSNNVDKLSDSKGDNYAFCEE